MNGGTSKWNIQKSLTLREEDDEEARRNTEQVDWKTAQCDRKFDETEQIVKGSFWTRFAEEAITTLAKEAELALDQAEATNHQQMTRRERELVNRDLEREVFELIKGVNVWMDLIPRSKLTESRDRSRKLKKRHEKLWDKWTW